MTAFDAQMTEQIPRLRRYARALLGEPARADDLVQDTLERAWSRAHRWQRGSDLRAWLFTIMHNLFINNYRRESRSDLISLDESAEIPVRDGTEQSMDVRDLHRALDKLPLEYRETLLLVALEQLTYEEAASILAIPVGTVMSRLSRGRERLRALLCGAAPIPLRRIK